MCYCPNKNFRIISFTVFEYYATPLQLGLRPPPLANTTITVIEPKPL